MASNNATPNMSVQSPPESKRPPSIQTLGAILALVGGSVMGFGIMWGFLPVWIVILPIGGGIMIKLPGLLFRIK